MPTCIARAVCEIQRRLLQKKSLSSARLARPLSAAVQPPSSARVTRHYGRLAFYTRSVHHATDSTQLIGMAQLVSPVCSL